jgi:hypothetical protein
LRRPPRLFGREDEEEQIRPLLGRVANTELDVLVAEDEQSIGTGEHGADAIAE